MLKKKRKQEGKSEKTPENRPDRHGQYNLWFYMKSRIEGYGFSYSFKDFFKVTAIFLAIMFLVGYFLKLQPLYLAIFLAIVLAQLPFMIISQFKYIYEQNRFNEVTSYMQQMAYSFKKNAKILLALKDTEEVCNGKMKQLVAQAIDIIENSSSVDVYHDAFAPIEEAYGCSRLQQLHKFLITVEEKGGEYQNAIDILIDDISNWEQRTFIYQKERSDIKTKIMISLCLSLGICSTTLFMLPANMDITSNMFYQIESTVCLAIFVLIYTLTQTKLNGSWLVNDAIKDETQIRRDYDIVHNSITAEQLKKSRKKVILLIPLIAAGAIIKNVPVMVLSAILMFLVYRMPTQKIKLATKRMLREIEKEFPGWCREVALNLQTENVFRAIELTQEDAPFVLQEPLRIMIEEINENPRSVTPYNNFLAEYNIPEVNRMMKTLYSLSEFGVQNAEEQINKIIIQNNAMVDKAERMKNEDSTTGVKFLTLVPMVLGSIKMMADLFLLCGSFISIAQSVM